MKEIWNESCILSPSLICLDMCNLESQIRILEQSGINVLHVDILDGHFSPSMPLGLDTVKQLHKKTNLEFEAHVMVKEPQFFIDELIEAGASQIVFHVETCDHIDGMLNYIHSKGIRAGVALKPATPLSVLEYVLDKCDAKDRRTAAVRSLHKGTDTFFGTHQMTRQEPGAKDRYQGDREAESYIFQIKIVADIGVCQIQKKHAGQAGFEYKFVGNRRKMIVDQSDLFEETAQHHDRKDRHGGVETVYKAVHENSLFLSFFGCFFFLDHRLVTLHLTGNDSAQSEQTDQVWNRHQCICNI